MTYKVTTQFTPFELVYGIQPIMPVEFTVKELGMYPQKTLIKPFMYEWKISSDWMKNVGMLVKTSIIYSYCKRKIGMKKGNSKTFVRVI